MAKRFLKNLRCLVRTHGPLAASISACFRFSVFVSLFLACDPSLCRGGPILQTPGGLQPGDQFRFVFLTDGTTNATSPNISTYDTFVTAQAGGATYNGVTITWQAIGSTATDNAVNHIGSSTAGVYLASGAEVAASTTSGTNGLWSGTLLHAIDQDLTGSTFSELVWTGTAKSAPFGHTSVFPLGDSVDALAKPADSGATDANWIANTIFGSDYTVPNAMYGISQVLTVPTPTDPVPEPSSFAMLGLGGIGVAFYVHRRRRAGV